MLNSWAGLLIWLPVLVGCRLASSAARGLSLARLSDGVGPEAIFSSLSGLEFVSLPRSGCRMGSRANKVHGWGLKLELPTELPGHVGPLAQLCRWHAHWLGSHIG